MRKHSYRELAKRRFSHWVLFYLQDPEDAETIFEHNNFTEKESQQIKTAYDIAKILKQHYAKGQQLSLKAYSPYIKEIREALIGRKQVTQPQLFL